ncbi:MAG: type II CAAX endopeptidase family protein [Phycisphaeraceae bacterium]
MNLPQRFEPPRHCDYCGARLHAAYYFCPGCSKPYKSIESVLPRRRPVQLSDEARIASKVPQLWTVTLAFTGVALAASWIPAILFSHHRPDLALFVATVAIAMATAVFAVIYWRTLAVQVGRPGFTHWAAWAGLGALVPLLALNLGWHAAFEALFRQTGVDEFTALRREGVSIAALVVMFGFVPAVTEEIAFRGLIQHWLEGAIAPARAVVLASALFAGAHVWAWVAIWSLPYLFLVGLLLGWVKWRTGSLYPSMVIHLLHNLAIVAITLASQ